MRNDHRWDRKRKMALAGLMATIVALLVMLPATAMATLPKPLGIYDSQYVDLQADQTARNLSNFDGYCTASKSSPYSFAVFFGIPVKSSGKFKWSGQNAVNTPDGGTLADTSLVTISGKFTSKKKVSGTYQLHKAGCKKVKFKAKLIKN